MKLNIEVFGPVPKAGLETFEDYAERGDNIAVLCDGASESYDSRSWARLLAAKFMENQKIDLQWAEDAAVEYAAKCKPATLTWSQEAAFERGSFSTLLGLVFDPETGSATIIAVGDSVAFLIRHETNAIDTTSFPYTSSEQFANNPVLLSTNRRKNPADFPILKNEWKNIGKDDRILMMTDALAQWALRQNEQKNSLNKLLEVQTQEEFTAFIQRERDKKSIRMDDCTLIRIALQTQGDFEPIQQQEGDRRAYIYT